MSCANSDENNKKLNSTVDYNLRNETLDSLRVYKAGNDTTLNLYTGKFHFEESYIRNDTLFLLQSTGYFAGFDFEIQLALADKSMNITGLKWSDAAKPTWYHPLSYELSFSTDEIEIGDSLKVKINMELMPADSSEHSLYVRGTLMTDEIEFRNTYDDYWRIFRDW